MLRDRQDVIAIAKQYEKKEKYKYALRLLRKARKRTSDYEKQLEFDCKIASVYCSMEQYGQAVDMLREILKSCDTEWTWEVYFLLAKALSHTKGHFSEETLDAYLNCVKYRKKFDEYGKGDLKMDISLCHNISEIYRVKKKSAAFSQWFREEMVLRDANCDIAIKNKIKDLSDRAVALADENNIEEALRQYEEVSYLIEKHIGINCDKYAVVQLKMGRLYYIRYAIPRYELASECFQRAIQIKRKYMSDISDELSLLFSDVSSEITGICRKSIADIRVRFHDFMITRELSDREDPSQLQHLVNLRDELINLCNEILPLVEEVFQADSLELAEIYNFIGESYKWCPVDFYDTDIGASYFEKTAAIWMKYQGR